MRRYLLVILNWLYNKTRAVFLVTCVLNHSDRLKMFVDEKFQIDVIFRSQEVRKLILQTIIKGEKWVISRNTKNYFTFASGLGM